MIAVQHFGSISDGKDSQAVLCRMVERIAYLDDWLRQRTGLRIETVSANDVPGLTDDTAFARKRAMLREEWSKEKRRTRHRGACNQHRHGGQARSPGLSGQRNAIAPSWCRRRSPII